MRSLNSLLLTIKPSGMGIDYVQKKDTFLTVGKCVNFGVNSHLTNASSVEYGPVELETDEGENRHARVIEAEESGTVTDDDFIVPRPHHSRSSSRASIATSNFGRTPPTTDYDSPEEEPEEEEADIADEPAPAPELL
ncbi:hypothetical protein K435DRAFT_846965 [Dendrothele bispora CBS 962.96]|uniref:Uncharacterized protein n=1 Tax=Dendrothele bispora (strain CBS 962.96) TaxID=1314807 RepID=A0A4S8KIR8_DENBC|nr:hypothetical protein K435DRAFT_846965 [Dendrothele bispora CBS 962.96]